MYMLQDPSGRELCLRPEMTISAARAFLGGMSSRRLPVRLSYSGEVFRYDRVREGRYRQFLQAGVEHIGGKNQTAADVEAVTLALELVRNVGISGSRLVVGDLELATEFISLLPAPAGVRNKLLESFWRPNVFELLLNRFSKPTSADAVKDNTEAVELAEVFSSLGERESHLLVRQILSLFVEKDIGARDLDEIAERFLGRFAASKAMHLPQNCHEAIQEYLSISGPPEHAIRRIKDLLKTINVTSSPAFDSLQRRVELLMKQDVLPESVTLDLGFRRGIEYYTGLIFEIHCDSIGRPVSQVCGGGRYDKLLSTLGAAKQIPAVGFAVGVDRLLLALEKDGQPRTFGAPPDALLVTVGSVPEEAVWEVARAAREAGWRVRTDFDKRRLSDSLGYASEEEIPYVIIAGEDELRGGQVRVRDMLRRTEELLTIDRLKQFVKTAGRGEKAEGMS
jgi:histidyl-tRNA synthetase